MKEVKTPIVTVLGHVDHGKTTLLDVIRKTSVAAREAGGITQSIGASKITTKEGEITFIDTPGHAAFRKMRERGTRIADIALLVVAADDGVKPQTEEALDYILQSETLMIVVLTKTDLPSSDVERVKTQLTERGVRFEGEGGDVPCIAVSAKEGRGIGELIEMIELVAEVNGLKADREAALRAVVIETRKDTRGRVVWTVVKDGSLRVGENVKAGGVRARVRGLFDENGRQVPEAGPGSPVLVLGFSDLPEVGDEIVGDGSGGGVEGVITEETKAHEDRMRKRKVAEGEIGIVLKTASSGTLEAVENSIPRGVVILEAGVGEINDTDIFLAKAGGARVIAFETKAPTAVKKLAETEEVKIETFGVIYELIKRLEELVEGGKEKIKARAVIVQVFPYKKRRVAGSKIEEGEMVVGESVFLVRGEEKVGKVKLVSMRKQKHEIKRAKVGEECGILFEPGLDFKEGDMLVSFQV